MPKIRGVEMKKLMLLVLVVTVFIVSCSLFTDTKLKKGTPAYDLATSLSKNLPIFDPEKNNVFVQSKFFKVYLRDVIQVFQLRFGNQQEQLTKSSPEQLKNMLDQVVNSISAQRLFYNSAQQAKIQVKPAEVDSFLKSQYNRMGGEQKVKEYFDKLQLSMEYVRKDIEESIASGHYINELFKKEIPVTEDQVQEKYNQDKTASVRHILLLTQGKKEEEKKEIFKKMEKILSEAKQGKDFAKLAEKYSEDPGSKAKGGLYEDFPRGQMVKSFEDASFSVPIGEISNIVETSYGYHIIKVIDRKKETKPLNEIREQIEDEIRNPKKREVYQARLEQLKKEAELKISNF
jgi:foldase protein PrsA